MCIDEESKEIAKKVMKSNKVSREKDIEEILAKNWQQFRCSPFLVITMQRPAENDEPHLRTMQFKATFDFVHFLILTRKYRSLLQFLTSVQGPIYPKVVQLEHAETGDDFDKGKQKPSRGDSWIFGANYLHSAVKYCPEALEILLQDQRFDELIGKSSTKRQVFPIHLAVMNDNNLSSYLATTLVVVTFDKNNWK